MHLVVAKVSLLLLFHVARPIYVGDNMGTVRDECALSQV